MNTQHETSTIATAYEKLVRQFYVPFNTGDVSMYDSILDPNWVDDPLMPGQQAGPQGIKDRVATLQQVAPDYHVTNDEIVIMDNRVAVHSTVRGTHTSTFFGIPATGRQFVMRTCDFHHVEHGVIVYTWHLEDFFGLLQQFGAFPGPGH